MPINDNDTSPEFENINNNQDRREYVGREFMSGEFSSRKSFDFFLDQYLKGELVIDNTPENKEKLKELLGGDQGILQAQEKIAAKAVKDFASDRKVRAGVATTGMAVSENMVEVDAKELTDAISSYKKRSSKDDVNDLIKEAQIATATYRFDGGFSINRQLQQTLENKKDSLSFWKVGQKLKLEKAIRDMDPSAYWSTKKTNAGNWFTNQYYKARGWFADRNDNAVERNTQKLEAVMKLKNIDASTKWMSKQFGKKLGAKFKLFFRASEERLQKRILKRANQSDLKKLQDKIAGFTAENSGNQYFDRKLLEAQAKRAAQLEAMSKACTERSSELEKLKETTLESLGAREFNSKDKPLDKLNTILNDKVAKIQYQYAEAMAKDPKLQAYMKLNGGQLPENELVNREIITTDAVLQQMCKDLGFESADAFLKAQGLSDNEIESIKQKITAKKSANEEKTAEEEQSDNQQETIHQEQQNATTLEAEAAQYQNQAEEVKETAPAGRASIMGSEYNYDDRFFNFSLDGYAKGDGENFYTAENGNTLVVGASKDSNDYFISARDAEGQRRSPEGNEIDILVKQMVADGITNVNLNGDFDGATKEAMLQKFAENNIVVNNREEVEKEVALWKEKQPQEKVLDQEVKQAEPEVRPTNEETKQPETEAKTLEEQAKNNETNANTAEQSPKVQTPNADKVAEEKMSMEKVMINAVTNSASQEEQIKKIKMIESIQKGEKIAFAEINDTFGAKSAEAVFLREVAAAKELQGLNEYLDNKEWIKDEKTNAGIRDVHDSNKVTIVSTVAKMAEKFKDKDIKDVESDDAFKLLPKYAQQGVKNLISVENSKDLTPKQKTTFRGQILGKVVEGKMSTINKANSGKNRAKAAEKINLSEVVRSHNSARRA